MIPPFKYIRSAAYQPGYKQWQVKWYDHFEDKNPEFDEEDGVLRL